MKRVNTTKLRVLIDAAIVKTRNAGIAIERGAFFNYRENKCCPLGALGLAGLNVDMLRVDSIDSNHARAVINAHLTSADKEAFWSGFDDLDWCAPSTEASKRHKNLHRLGHEYGDLHSRGLI